MRPGKTGKYAALDVVWEATTQGGECSWMGDLTVENESQRQIQSGDIPKARGRFSFEFDARPLAKATKREGYFQGIVNCGHGDGGAATALHGDHRRSNRAARQILLTGEDYCRL